MKTRYRKTFIFFWVACQVIAFSLLFPTHVYADDCGSDPLNAADCMRTDGFRQVIAVAISLGGTLATIAVSALSGAATATGETAARAVTDVATDETTNVATDKAIDEAIDEATADLAFKEILDIIQNNPQINGGPGDNGATSFDGGDGPGSCSINGLPNYWVNTANLNLYVEDMVYTYRGLGPAIVLKLSYNSAPGNAGMFGRNWRFSYESVIQQIPERLLLWKGSGQRLGFQPAARPRDQAPNAPLATISLDGSRERLFDYGPYFLLVEPQSRLSYRYDKSPGTTSARLTAIADQNNNAVKLTYSRDGSLQSVTDAAGRVTNFVYDSSRRCIGFSLPDGRQAKYTYDGQGNLTQAVDLLGTTALYEYDKRNNLTRMIVGRDKKTTTFTYRDNGQGQYLAGVTDAAGNSTRYELVSGKPRHIRVTDREGYPTSYYSAPQGYTERVVNPLGSMVVTGFANGLPVSFTNPNQQTSRMEYDMRGNIIRRVNQLRAVWASAYDNNDRLISETDPLGAAWQYVYDDCGNLVRTLSPQGRAISLEYDGKGQVISIVDNVNRRVRFAYDAFGNVVSRTDPTGSTTHMTYDKAGMRLIVYTDARGHATHYEYDANDRLTRVTYPDGTFRSFAYDCCAGVSVVDENGNQTNYRRDPMLLLGEQKNAAGSSTLFTYDRNYRPVKSVNALGHTTTFGYDAAGRRVREVNSLGKIIQAQYDPNSNLVALVNQLGKANSFEYDAANRQVRAIDPLGQALTIVWDALSRPSEIIGARGGKVGMSYSPDGNLDAKTYNGVKTAAYEYDDTGNLSRLEDPTGTHLFTYDPAGQVSAIHYPDGTRVVFSYDEARNLNSILYPGNLKVFYACDQRNRVTKLSWQDQSVFYQYNAGGAVIGETRSNGVESTYTYDANGRMSELRHVRGGQPFAQVSYTRNADGDITGETGSQPMSAQHTEAGGETLYNDLDQIVSRGQERYTYDADGNLTGISGGKWQAGYDLENRPQEVTRDGQTVAYLYNGLGQRVQAAKGAAIRNYHYDLNGRLLFETDGKEQVTCCYIYSGALLAARYTPDGQSFFYHFNHQGSTLAVTDADGGMAAAYVYTPFGLLAGQSGVLQNNPFTFVGAYGVMDEGGGLYYMKNRYYDANTGRFIQKDPLGIFTSLNLYGYVGDNPLNRIDPLGLFDRGFPNNYLDGKPIVWSADLSPVVGPMVAATNAGIGIVGVVSAVSTGIASGGSVPLAIYATVKALLAIDRIYTTVKQAANGEYSDSDNTLSTSVRNIADPANKYWWVSTSKARPIGAPPLPEVIKNTVDFAAECRKRNEERGPN